MTLFTFTRTFRALSSINPTYHPRRAYNNVHIIAYIYTHIYIMYVYVYSMRVCVAVCVVDTSVSVFWLPLYFGDEVAHGLSTWSP